MPGHGKDHPGMITPTREIGATIRCDVATRWEIARMIGRDPGQESDGRIFLTEQDTMALITAAVQRARPKPMPAREREHVRHEIAERIRLAEDAKVPGPPDPPITSPNFPAVDRNRLLAEADKVMDKVDAYAAAAAHRYAGEVEPVKRGPGVAPLAEKESRILADAKILAASKFVNAAYATNAQVSHSLLVEHVIRELAANLARRLIEQVPIGSILAKDQVPHRGAGYDYSVEVVLLTRGQLEELSRLNREIRRAANVDDATVVSDDADDDAAPERRNPDEAGPADYWRWRFPRPGRYYAEGMYVDIHSRDTVIELPPGYPLWITAEGVQAERLPEGEL